MRIGNIRQGNGIFVQVGNEIIGEWRGISK